MIAWGEELGIPYMTLYLRLYRRKLPVDVAFRPGKPPTARRGEANNKSKLTETAVRTIRAEYSTGASSLAELAARYGIATSAVWAAATGKTWKHIR